MSGEDFCQADGRGARRLLVIDDEEEYRRILRLVAEGAGYVVADVGTAEQFKEAYKAEAPTAIILDLIMPEVDGIELVRWLAREGCKAKVFIISGYSPLYIKLAGTLAQASGIERVECLTKPLEIGALRAALESTVA